MDRSIALLPNEQALAARAKAEPEAFAAIYDHYFPRVYNFVRYRVQDAQTADDITAQVFEKALTGIDRYLPMQGSLGAWLFGNGRRIMWSSTWLVAFANFGYHWYLKIEKNDFIAGVL